MGGIKNNEHGTGNMKHSTSAKATVDNVKHCNTETLKP